MLRTVLAALTVFAFVTPAAADLTRHKVRVDGDSRTYFLFVPDAPPPSAGRPLVYVLHGGGGTARGMARSIADEIHAFAETERALIVYPQAIDRSWDFGEGVVSERMDQRRDDLKFLTGLASVIDRRHKINRQRIFATGISRGGQASYFLACKSPGFLAAIAPVTMSLPEFLLDDCRTAPRIPILVMNGTADPLVPYNGGPITVGRKERGNVISTAETMSLFRRKNGCGSGTTTRKIGRVDVLAWRNCRERTVLYRVNGGGHTWPGGQQYLPVRVVGPVNRDISATREIWKFFFPG
ncbi:MAG: alpha/beta hydrolase family esterase [Boseongicola sp.]